MRDADLQRSMMDSELRRLVEKDETFLEIMNGPNPLTKDELACLIEKRPQVWGRFAKWVK